MVTRVGLIGFGRAGQAVARVLGADPRFVLCWVARRHASEAWAETDGVRVPSIGLDHTSLADWLDRHPVDALVDFSRPDALWVYGDLVRERGLSLVSAISNYGEDDLSYLRSLGECARVMASPNITLGINFLILASRLLHTIAPFADVEIVEQHFREKPDASGTARKIAQTLEVDAEHITSLRLGGIVGHHEVIFGFPHQTVRLIHDSIRREAFGTGAAFALSELVAQAPGFYTYEDLLMRKARAEILRS